MTKKEFIINVLDLIKDERVYASGLIYLLMHSEENPIIINTIVELLESAKKQAEKESNNKKQSKLLEHSIQLINQIRDKQQISYQEDKNSIQELESIIQSM